MRNLIRITVAAAALSVPAGGFAAHRAGNDAGTDRAGGGRLAQMCDEGSRDITALPIDQFKRTIQADDAQRAALDELVKAALKAAQGIKAACPTEELLSATGRLAAMQARIEAMIAAVATVRPPLEEFYALLSDEQKEKIVALGRNRHQGRTGSLLEQDCGSAQSSVTAWPSGDIERRVHPTEAQRASLVALQDAAAKATEISKAACPAPDLMTPTARLAAIDGRLAAMLQGVKTVAAPLNELYAMLDDEQKARFNAISLPQTSQMEQSKGKPTAVHRHRVASIGYLIRRWFHWF